MKLLQLLVTIIAFIALFGILGCEVEKEQSGQLPDVDVQADEGELPEYKVEKTEEGELPSVDVDAEGGRLPEYDVKGPDVEVTAQTEQVTVPDVDVEMEERQVEVPDVDVEMPKDDTANKNTSNN